MSDPMDTYRELMDTRPRLLDETPTPMREWIGRVIQQYGTEAGRLQTLQAEHKALKKLGALESRYEEYCSEVYSAHADQGEAGEVVSGVSDFIDWVKETEAKERALEGEPENA